MPAARKIGAVVLIAVSAIVLVGCLALVVGAWIGRAALLRATREAAEQVLELGDAADGALVRVNERLRATRERTATVRERAQAFEARDLDETAFSALVQSVRDRVRDEVSPAIERVTDAADTVRDRLEALDRVVHLSNRWSDSDLPEMQAAGIALASEAMATVRTRVADLNERIASARLDSRQDVADAVTRLADGMDAVVAPVTERVASTQTRLSNLKERVRSAPDRLDARVLRPVAIGATLLFGWLGLGQAALIAIGWRGLAVRRDPRATNSAPTGSQGK
jgi:hypothetical protein